MRINKTKREARNALRGNDEPPEAFTIEDLNPRGQIAKTMEMSARRSIALHNALALALGTEGTVESVKRKRFIGQSNIEKQLKIALGDRPYRSPTWRTAWDWTVDQWWDGAFKRGLDEAMMCMPAENRKRVQKEMDKMQAIEMGDDE